MLTARKVESVKDGTYSDEVHTFLGPPTDSSPIIGNTFSHRRMSWLARGSNLVFVDNVSSRILAFIDLSDFVHDSCSITCGVELEYPDSQYPLLLLGCATALGGMLIIYDPSRRRGYRAVDLDIEITCLCVINSNTQKLSVLPTILKGMNGVVVAGGIDGSIIVIDLCTNLIDKAMKGEFDRGHESWIWPKTTSRVQYVNYNDNEYTISCKKLLCKKNNESLCFVLNDKEGEVQAPQQNGINSPVTSLHYNANTVSLFAGFEAGVWHMYNIITLNCVFISSTETGSGVSVVSMSSLEPSDDPRATVYLWVCHSSPPKRPAPILSPAQSPVQSPVRTKQLPSPDDPPFSIMYALMFREKTFLPSYGIFYLDFLQCSVAYELEMTKDFSNFLSGRFISVNAILTSFRHNYLCKERGEEYEELALWSIAWECGDASVETYLTIFDLNQWYKDQMPSEPKPLLNGSVLDVPLKDTGYFTTVRLPNPTRQTHIAVSVDPSSIDAFRALYPIDAHYYPSALSFGVMCVGSEGISLRSVMGIQEWAIRTLSQNGPLAMSQPSQAVQGCLSAALLPLFDDLNTTFTSTMSPDACRSFIVTVCVENGIADAILDCARHWFDTMGSDESCSVSFLVNTLWDILILYKKKFDSLSVSLFDRSGIEFDFTSRTTLQFCYLMMKQVCDIFLKMQNEFSFEITTCDIEHKVEAVQLIIMYTNLVQWSLNVKLLPEKSSMGLPETAIPYHFDLLRTDTEHRRKTNSLMIDAVIKHYIPDAKEHWGRLYPPSNIQALLRVTLIPGVSENVKHLIIHYFLLDIVHTIPHEKYSDSIEEILKYHYFFNLSESASRIIQAYWDVDRANFQDAVDSLLDISVKRSDMEDWEHRLILDVLYKNKEYSNAFKYLKGKRPPLNSVSDMKLEITLTVAVGNIANALFFTRQRTSIRDLLRNHFFQECVKFSHLKALYHLPLDQVEEKSFLEFLGRSKDPESQDCVLYFFISRKRFTEAFVHYDKMKISGICGIDTKSRNRDLIIQGLKKSLGPVAIFDRYAWDAQHSKPPPELNGVWKPTSAYLKFDSTNPKKPRLLTSPREFTAIACWQAQKLMTLKPTAKPTTAKPRDEDILSQTIVPEVATAAVRAAAKRKLEAPFQEMHTPLKRPRELLAASVESSNIKEAPSTPNNRLNYSLVQDMVSTPIVAQKVTPSHKSPPSRPASILKSRSVRKDEILLEEPWTDSIPKKISFSLPVDGERPADAISKKKLFSFEESLQDPNENSVFEAGNEASDEQITPCEELSSEQSNNMVDSKSFVSQSESSEASNDDTGAREVEEGQLDQSLVTLSDKNISQKNLSNVESQVQPDTISDTSLGLPTSFSELSSTVVQSVAFIDDSKPCAEPKGNAIRRSTSKDVTKEDSEEFQQTGCAIVDSNTVLKEESSVVDNQETTFSEVTDIKLVERPSNNVDDPDVSFDFPKMPVITSVQSVVDTSFDLSLDEGIVTNDITVQIDASPKSKEESGDGLYDDIDIHSSEGNDYDEGDECLADQAEGEPDVEPPRESSSLNVRRNNPLPAQRAASPDSDSDDDVVCLGSDSNESAVSEENSEYSEQGSPHYSDEGSNEEGSYESYEPESPSSDSADLNDVSGHRVQVNGANSSDVDDVVSCETLNSQDSPVQDQDNQSGSFQRVSNEAISTVQLQDESLGDTGGSQEDSDHVKHENVVSENLSIVEVFDGTNSSDGEMTGIVEDMNETPANVSSAPDNVEIVEVEMDSDMDSFNVTGNVNILNEDDIVDQVIGHTEEIIESSEDINAASESIPLESKSTSNKDESILFKSTSTEFGDAQSDESSSSESCISSESIAEERHSPCPSESSIVGSKEPVEVIAGPESQENNGKSCSIDVAGDESRVTSDNAESLIEDVESSHACNETVEKADVTQIIETPKVAEICNDSCVVIFKEAVAAGAEAEAPGKESDDSDVICEEVVVAAVQAESLAKELNNSDVICEEAVVVTMQGESPGKESDDSDVNHCKESEVSTLQTESPEKELDNSNKSHESCLISVTSAHSQSLKLSSTSQPVSIAENLDIAVSAVSEPMNVDENVTSELEISKKYDESTNNSLKFELAADSVKSRSSREKQSVRRGNVSLNVSKPKLVDRSVLTDNDSIHKTVSEKSASVAGKDSKHVELIDRSVLTDYGGLDKTVIFHSRKRVDHSPEPTMACETEFSLPRCEESDLTEDDLTMDDSVPDVKNISVENVTSVDQGKSTFVEPSKQMSPTIREEKDENNLYQSSEVSQATQSSQAISAIDAQGTEPESESCNLSVLKSGETGLIADQSSKDSCIPHEVSKLSEGNVSTSMIKEEKKVSLSSTSKFKTSKDDISTVEEVHDTVIFKEIIEPQKSCDLAVKSGVDDESNQTLNTALFVDVDSDSRSSTALEIVSIERDPDTSEVDIEDEDNIMETGFLGESLSSYEDNINSDSSSIIDTAFVHQSASQEGQSISSRNLLVSSLLKSASKSRRNNFLDITVGVTSEVSQPKIKLKNVVMTDKCVMTDKSYLVRQAQKARKLQKLVKERAVNSPQQTYSTPKEMPIQEDSNSSRTPETGHVILTRSLTKKRQSVERDLSDHSAKQPKPKMIDQSVLTDNGGLDKTVIFHSRKSRAQSLQPESPKSEWKSAGMGNKVKSHENLASESTSSKDLETLSNARVIRKLFRRTKSSGTDSVVSNLTEHPSSLKLVASASVENLSQQATSKKLRRNSSSMDLNTFDEGSNTKGPSVLSETSNVKLENLAKLRKEERKSRLSQFSNLHGIVEVPEVETDLANDTRRDTAGPSSKSLTLDGRVFRVAKRRTTIASSTAVKDAESEESRGPPELEEPVSGKSSVSDARVIRVARRRKTLATNLGVQDIESDARVIGVARRRKTLAPNLGVKDIESEESRGPPELEEPVPVPNKRSRRRTTSSSSEPPSLEPEGEMEYKVLDRKQRASSHGPETKATRSTSKDLFISKGYQKRQSRSLHENEEIQASPLRAGMVTPSKTTEDDQAYTPSDYSENRRLTRHQKLLIERSMVETPSPSTPQTPKRGRRAARSVTPDLTPTRSSQRLLNRRIEGKK